MHLDVMFVPENLELISIARVSFSEHLKMGVSSSFRFLYMMTSKGDDAAVLAPH